MAADLLVFTVVDHSINSPGIVDLVNALAGEGKKVTVLTGPKSDIAAWDQRVRVVTLPMARKGSWLRYLVWAYLVAKQYHDGCSLLLGVNDTGAYVCRLAQTFCKHAEVIIWAREMANLDRLSYVRRLLLKWAYHVDLCLEPSRERAALRHRILRMKRKPVELLNAPPLSRFENVQCRVTPRNEEPFRIIYAGAVSARSLLHCLVKALPLVRVRILLEVFGPDFDDYSNDLISLANSLGVRKCIQYRGRIDRAQLPDAYAKAHAGIVFYSHSSTVLNERLCAPNKFFEYLASGLPVLASSNLTLRRWLRESGAGVAVELGKPEDIAAGVEYLRRNLEHCSKAAIGKHRNHWNFEAQAHRAFVEVARGCGSDDIMRTTFASKKRLPHDNLCGAGNTQV